MPRTALWLVGGLCCALGLLSLLFSFATPWGPISVHLSEVGWDAAADIATTDQFPLAVMYGVLGVPLLIWLNATAWRETGGY